MKISSEQVEARNTVISIQREERRQREKRDNKKEHWELNEFSFK